MAIHTNYQRSPSNRLTVAEEILLSYLIPSYETMTSKLIRAQEAEATLLKMLDLRLDTFLLNKLLDQLAREIAELKASLIKHESDLKDQIKLLAQLDDERFKLIDLFFKQLKEIEDLRNRIDLLLNKTQLIIQLLDNRIKILQNKNEKIDQQIASLINGKIRKTEDEDIHSLKIGDKTLLININEIENEILNLKLQKNAANATNLDIDIDRVIDRHIAKTYKKLQANNPSLASQSLSEFLKQNASEISIIKKKVKDNVSKSNLDFELKHLLEEKNKNNEEIKFTQEKLKQAEKILEKIEKVKNEFDDKCNTFKSDLTREMGNVNEINLLNTDVSKNIENFISTQENVLNTIGSAALELDEIEKDLDSFDFTIALPETPIADSSPALQHNQEQYNTTYEQLISTLNIHQEAKKRETANHEKTPSTESKSTISPDKNTATSKTPSPSTKDASETVQEGQTPRPSKK